jgi:hypothetical protein
MEKVKSLKGSVSALLLGVLLISGCASTQSSYQIRLNVIDHIPHCGGAFPSPEQVNGVDQALTGEVFGLISGKTFSDSMQEPILLLLDEKGSCSLNLHAGTYSLVLLDKWMESAAFMKKHSIYDTQLYKVNDATCFEKWRTSVDYSFVVHRDSIVTYVRQNNCYTGTNPCLEYIGPKAP